MQEETEATAKTVPLNRMHPFHHLTHRLSTKSSAH